MSEELTLYIGGLSYDTTEQSLEESFCKYGAVTKVEIIRNRETHKSRGFGFVTFENPDEAKDAVIGMNGKPLDGRTIRVDEAGKSGGNPGGVRGSGSAGGGDRSGGRGYFRGGRGRGGGYGGGRDYGGGGHGFGGSNRSYGRDQSYGNSDMNYFGGGGGGYFNRRGGYSGGGGYRDNRNQGGYERSGGSYRDGYDSYGI